MARALVIGTKISVACDGCPQSEQQEFPPEITDRGSNSGSPVSVRDKCGAVLGRTLSGPQVFNRRGFIERMLGDEEFAHQIAGTFAHRLPGMLDEVKKSMDSGSVEGFGSAIHKIKGSAANVGGEALSDVARQIEQNELPQDLPELIAELESQAELLVQALQAWSI